MNNGCYCCRRTKVVYNSFRIVSCKGVHGSITLLVRAVLLQCSIILTLSLYSATINVIFLYFHVIPICWLLDKSNILPSHVFGT